ncbi:hypothetical protein H4218_002089 [Coemansia sp. IMI 209128]|nr:hypothetical protein GGI10_001454 [Coemansia sp. RSA 2530]KAJ2700356.1 hypothetical protein H4218_002089 [Coemansia sp. IMI 209128]
MDEDAKLPPKADFTNSNESSSVGAKPAPPASDSDPGFLGRIALSATQLAGSISQGTPILDSDALAEAKLGRREGSTSASQSHVAEGSQSRAAYSQRRPELASMGGGAASAFRQQSRAIVGDDNRPSHGVLDYKGKSASTDSHDQHSLLRTTSHQVGLAQSLDGQDVAKLLSQTMPTDMSVMPTSATAYKQQWSRPKNQGWSQPESIDPVAYLQSTGYAVDMELVDHQVPQSTLGATDGQTLSASPVGASRGWDEHEALVLEEWQLNEAWDRAWMDTAWGSAQKKAPVEPRADPVLPSNKNLSYLLKPRI